MSTENTETERPVTIRVLTSKNLRPESKKAKVISAYDFLSPAEYAKADYVFYIDENEDTHILKARNPDSLVNGETVKAHFKKRHHANR